MDEQNQSLISSLTKLAKTVKTILEQPTAGASKGELVARLAIVSTAKEILKMYDLIRHDIFQNYDRLSDIEVGLIDAEDGDFFYP